LYHWHDVRSDECKFRRFHNQMTGFLNFCRLENGLSANSLEAYATDLFRFSTFLGEARAPRRKRSAIIWITYTNPA